MTATASPRSTAPESTPAPPASSPALVRQAGFLTRDALFARPLKTLDGEIPEMGRIRVRELKQAEREALDDSVMQKTFDDKGDVHVQLNNLGYRTRAAALALVNEDNSQFFPDADEGARLLGTLSTDVFAPIYDLMDALNKLSPKAQADARKASGGTDSAAS